MSTHTVTLDGLGAIELTVATGGTGRPVLLLHGGAGPPSVAGFAQLLVDRHPAQVYTPTHPGFGGTPRPDWLTTIPRLAEVYARLLDQLDLDGVTMVGNSVGGWIASELALRDSRRIRSMVLIDAVGIVVEGHPVADVFSLSLDDLSKLSYHDPVKFRIDPTKISEQQRAGMAANRAALAVYGGQPSTPDPTLRARLHEVRVPTLVLWGDSDRVVDPEYGRAYAAAIPHAVFRLLPNTDHIPQIETPEQLLTAVWDFVAAHAPSPPDGKGGSAVASGA
jgi:pimeloyl-ACP methyl ester carboxylesterase